jgi:hypothetical protein
VFSISATDADGVASAMDSLCEVGLLTVRRS